MRFMPALALGVMVPVAGAVMLAAPAIAAKKDDAAGAPKLAPSAAFVKVYSDADKALKAGDIPTAKAKTAEAEKAIGNADDKFLYGNLLLNIGISTKEEDFQKNGLEQMMASGKVSPADAGKFSFFLGQFAAKAKQYDDAIKYYTAAVTGNYQVPLSYAATAQAYFSKAYANIQNNQFTPAGKQFAYQGLEILHKAVDAQAASGQPAEKAWYTLGFQLAAQSSAPDSAFWSAAALKNDPSQDNWRMALRLYQDGHKTLTREENLDLFRLMAATGSLKENYTYAEYVDDAMKSGLFGEAKSTIDKGRAAGNLSSTQLADYYKIASDGIPKDKASLPASEVDSNKAATGKPAVATANAYLGYGDYAKAATLYRVGLQKGGVDANEVNTRLGIALAMSGDTAGAKTAFAAVQSGNRKDIADFWTLYLNTKAA